MSRIHSNNYTTTLSGDITDSDLTMVVAGITNFPTIGAGVFCYLTLQDGSTIEIVKVTSNASTTLTIERAIEGTSASAFPSGSIISLRPTADSVDRKEDLISGRTLTTATVATDDKVLIQDTSGSNVLKTVTAQSIADLASGGGVSDGDKGDITVASSGASWTIDTPSSATVATDDKVLIKDTSASNVMKYVTAQSIADLATVSDGDKGDITVASSGTAWTIDTPSSVTVATDDKVLIKDTSASNVMKYVTAQSIADLATGGVTDGDKGDITVASSGTSWTIDTPSSATVATDDKVLIKDTSASNVMKYVTAQSIADLASSGGVADGDKGDITVSSSGATWTIDTPASATVATDDKVLIKDTSGSDVMKYVTAQSIADLASGATIPYNLQLGSSATGPSSITYFEDTDNGSNKITITVPSSIASDKTITFPDVTGTVCLDVGSANIVTVGTIATGTWNGTAIGVAYGGTGITSTTAYGVMIGGTSSTGAFQNAGTGTNGQVLQSAGSVSLPTWTSTLNAAVQNNITAVGTVTSGTWNATGIGVVYGGTGLATTTANGLLTGGTTGTSAFQNAGTGTSGQVYVSGGSSSLGTWTDGTGSGNIVKATSPTLTTPNIGTPSAGTLTSCTGLPISTGVSGLGTAMATFLATPSSANLRGTLTDESGAGAAVFADTPTLIAPLLGTPTSGTLTNCTGIPISTGVSGLASGIATFLATPSSANLATAVTNETGSGALVFGTSPALTTPDIGTPSAGTLTSCTGYVASNLSGSSLPSGLVAAQSDQETATSTTLAVTPGRQHFHPSAAKFWVNATGNGTTINASYNVTSLTDTGTGDMTVNIGNDLSSANWAAFSTIAKAGVILHTQVSQTLTGGTVRSGAWTFASTPTDPDTYFICGLGDL